MNDKNIPSFEIPATTQMSNNTFYVGSIGQGAIIKTKKTI